MSDGSGRDETVERRGRGDGVGDAAATHQRSGGGRTDHRHGGVRQELRQARLAERGGEAVDRRRRSEGDDVDLAAPPRREAARAVEAGVRGAIGLDAHDLGAERGEPVRERVGRAIAGRKEDPLAGRVRRRRRRRPPAPRRGTRAASGRPASRARGRRRRSRRRPRRRAGRQAGAAASGPATASTACTLVSTSQSKLASAASARASGAASAGRAAITAIAGQWRTRAPAPARRPASAPPGGSSRVTTTASRKRPARGLAGMAGLAGFGGCAARFIPRRFRRGESRRGSPRRRRR